MRFKMNRRNNSKEFIDIDGLRKKTIIDKIDNPIIYSPEEYGISAQYTGKGVKILVIDSGSPKHKDINKDSEKQDFASGDDDFYDNTGHGTMVAGVIAAQKKKSMIGIAPQAEMLYAKVTDSKGDSSYGAIVSSILWGIVKKVDIIVMALGSQYDYQVLHDAIKKASDREILIFAASGNNINKDDSEIDYPARYLEVYSVGNLTRTKKNNIKILEKVDFAMKNQVIVSTYLKNKYINVSGSSMSTAFVAGLASLLIEKSNKEKKKYIPQTIYSQLQKKVK
ncbi:MAG: S8 family serine peptidase [Clostridiales bacterium]|nr:S8 family serine peptidase [Clostridiales bacterium]